jgi:hypothetical protein
VVAVAAAVWADSEEEDLAAEASVVVQAVAADLGEAAVAAFPVVARQAVGNKKTIKD